MGIEKIFEEGIERNDAVDEIRSVIRQSINEAAKKKIDEKFEKKVEEESDEEDDGKDSDSGKKKDDDDESNDDDDDDDDEDDEKVEEGDKLNEAFEVAASRVGGRRGIDKFTINRMSDLKKLGKSRQYDYFMVTKKNGEEVEYSVDPQGNIVEL